jgi:dephospho-CoA kinase
VDADENLQISRATQRDAKSPEQIKKIIATQINRLERCTKADDIITNHGDLADLDLQVKKLNDSYLKLSQLKTF